MASAPEPNASEGDQAHSAAAALALRPLTAVSRLQVQSTLHLRTAALCHARVLDPCGEFAACIHAPKHLYLATWTIQHAARHL